MRYKLFFVSLFLANLNYILYNTLNISPLIKDGIRVVTILIVFLNIIVNLKSIKVYPIDMLLVMLIATSLLSFNINPNILNLMYIILIVFVSKEVPFEGFIKKNYINSIIGLCIVIIFLQIGLIQNVEYHGLERTRNTFGFKNVNAFSSYMYSCILIFITSRKKLNWVHIIFASIVITAIYRFSDTRTILLSYIIFIIMYLFLSFTHNRTVRKSFTLLTKLIVILIAIVPVFASFLSPIILERYPLLDRITSYRLSLNKNYMNENKIINFIFGGSTQPDIDNGFLVLFFSVGVIFSAFLVFMILRAICIQIDNNGYVAVAFIISFMYFNAFEALIIRPELSITIYFWVLIYCTLTTVKGQTLEKPYF